MFVEKLRRSRILERFVSHHMAPVASGIADREKDRLVLPPRPFKRSLTPSEPMHRVLGVLQKIR
jgi:hypothetical protein